MARLTLHCDDRALKHCDVGLLATIGRLPDNTLVIDSPTVSGHHACVFRDGDSFVVEDLASTNGTFVNDKRVSRQTLRNGDVVSVGRHTLVFDEAAAEDPERQEDATRIMSNPDQTIFLDADKYRGLLAMLKDTERQAAASSAARASDEVGVLRVLAGRADRAEYKLEAHTSLIGTSDSALVRLQGWFKPKEALAIARNGDGYVATVLTRTALINSQRVSGRHKLADGDVLDISGLTLEFSLRA